MEIKELKKFLSGFGIAGLIAGAGLTLGAGAGAAGSGCGGCAGKKGGTSVTAQQSSTQDGKSETKDEQVSTPTPTGNATGTEGKPAQPAPSSG